MIKKIKSVLSLTLSFIFLFLNLNVFAQEVQVESTIPYEEMQRLEREFNNAREMLDAYRSQLKQFKYIDGMISSPRSNIIHRVKPALEETTKLEEEIISLLREVDGFDTYISSQKEVPVLERLAYKYNAQKPNILFESQFLEEGAAFNKISDGISKLDKLANTEGVIAKQIMDEGEKQVQMFEDVCNYLSSRLDLAEEQAIKATKANSELYEQTMKLIQIAGITEDDIIEQAIRTIPEEDLKMIGLVKEVEAGKAGTLEIAYKLKRHLRKIGAKDQPSLFKLIRQVARNSWYKRVPGVYLTDNYPKYANIIENFPILENGKYVNPKYTIRRIIKAGPIIVIGAVLTAVTITEITSDNNFSEETRSYRYMAKLQKRVEIGEASFMESMVYYTDERSKSEMVKNPRHATNLINLALAVNNAEKDFDMVAKDLETEYAYQAQADEDVQNSFDVYYNSTIQKVGEGMI